jgi:hypothetical protein
MGAEPVEEEAVVADDHRATGEILQRRFQRLQGFHVQIVGRFVKQQHVAAGFQQLGHVDAVALPPDRRPTFFCWSPPLKLKAPQ